MAMKWCTWLSIGAAVLLLWGCSPRATTNTKLGAHISGHEISYLITAHPDWSSTGEVVDEDYQLVPHEWVDGLFRVFGEDCDDYAGEMWRNAVNGPGRPAFGMVTNTRLLNDNRFGGHVLNFYVSEDRELWLYEPQTGRRWLPSKEEMWYLRCHWI